jgi:hypothetical protein
MMPNTVRPEGRYQWQGWTALGLLVLFFVLDMPWLLIVHIEKLGLGHLIFAMITAFGLWSSWSGLKRGGRVNRFLSCAALIFFLAVVAVTVLRSMA